LRNVEGASRSWCQLRAAESTGGIARIRDTARCHEHKPQAPVVDAVIVYVAEATALLVCPVAVAMALIVSVADTATAAV